ncbi:hypothetical protein [methane-oxidizing endosymbiont of Gigantopelta aegis]|uniref:hypothetical protein n=1 Tax=methane-oxidizing endosymbiont of Gigantopelta aegis TaxID=2794938 RepID=UPI001FDA64CD|nr:hypothetical protein [methane-oxidizing endosymbiont of Gigantopelta aegis]
MDEYLQKNLHLTAKSVAAYIKERWQVRYSERGVTACCIAWVMSIKAQADTRQS